jgi:hypothetical protein
MAKKVTSYAISDPNDAGCMLHKSSHLLLKEVVPYYASSSGQGIYWSCDIVCR